MRGARLTCARPVRPVLPGQHWGLAPFYAAWAGTSMKPHACMTCMTLGTINAEQEDMFYA
jgi:hypothetical protein